MPSLTLVPSQQAVQRKFAGFHSGAPLKLNFQSGETCQRVLHRLNEYRSPDNQITILYTRTDLKERFPLNSILYSDLALFVA